MLKSGPMFSKDISQEIILKLVFRGDKKMSENWKTFVTN